MAACHFVEHLSWHLSRKSAVVFAPVGCLLSGNMESALPENTDKKIVCFRHIKVERLADKKPEFEMPPKESFFFLNIYIFIYIKVQRGKCFDIRGKNQMMLSTFPAFRFIHTSGNSSSFHASHFKNF